MKLTNHDRILLTPGRIISSVSGKHFSAHVKDREGVWTIYAATDTTLWEWEYTERLWHKILGGHNPITERGEPSTDGYCQCHATEEGHITDYWLTEEGSPID